MLGKNKVKKFLVKFGVNIVTMGTIGFMGMALLGSCSTPAQADKVVWDKSSKPKIVRDNNKTIRGCQQNNPLLEKMLGKPLNNPLKSKTKKSTCKGE